MMKEVLVKKSTRNEMPFSYMKYLQCMDEWKDPFTNIDVQLYRDNGELILLESKKIQIATYPKGARLEDSIIVHPRYANKKDFDIIEVRGYRSGRTIDIILPMPYYRDGENYDIINIKGVGASTHKERMIIDPERWFSHKENKWTPFNESHASLGRRWGMLDTYAGTLEYSNNIFEKFGIAQVPHLALNHAPKGVLPFDGVTQLVRGLKTNVRCDNDFADGWLQEQYVSADTFSNIDAKIFKVQKELFKEHKTIAQPIGRVMANRYLDGTFTDMENYTIKHYADEKELIFEGAVFCMDVLGSMSVANWDNRHEYGMYLGKLQTVTGIKLRKHANVPAEIFMNPYMSKEKFKKFIPERKKMFAEFKKDYGEYLKN